VGPPQELYSSPANLFVAGFIGSPAMNFMAGTLEQGSLRTALGDLTLTDQTRRAVESRGGERGVIVGIRPEDFEDASLVTPENRSDGVTFRASIDVVESMGSDVFVYFTLEDSEAEALHSAELEELAQDSGRADTGANEEQIVARLDTATTVREGAQSELWADSRKIHVFDPQTGENLSLERSSA
jgi:multiple sugar transport system ATP-binding protein